MLVLEFCTADVAQTRFAISPMSELVAGLRLLHKPSRTGPHLPWVREALTAALEVELGVLRALTPDSGYVPDFLTPPATSPLASFADELERVRHTPPEVVRREVLAVFGNRPRPPAVDELVAEPRSGLEQLTATIERWWQRAVEPHWPRLRALLDADLAHRARRLTAGGPAALFADLHPMVRWRHDRLNVATVFDAHVSLAGRGLVLAPSAYWQSVGPIIDPPWQPTLIYPARGVELLWQPGAAGPRALARVIGRSRADLLTALDAPRSTTALAKQIHLSPGAVSQHLAALRAAGLLSSVRHGREVLYLRTPLAEQLQRAAAPRRKSASSSSRS